MIEKISVGCLLQSWVILELGSLVAKGGLPQWLSGKNSTCTAGSPGDTGSIPGLRRNPEGRQWKPTPVFLPGESHGQRSLVGYSLRSHKESDTTEATERACTSGKEQGRILKLIEAKMATHNQQKQNEYNDHNEEQFQSDTQGA